MLKRSGNPDLSGKSNKKLFENDVNEKSKSFLDLQINKRKESFAINNVENRNPEFYGFIRNGKKSVFVTLRRDK